MLELNKIYNEDCLSGLKKMPDSSVDLVFTSPPYNMNLRIRNGKYCSRQIVKEISTKYQNFSDNLTMDEYFDFNKQVIEELIRVGGLVFYNVQFLTGNKVALFKLIGHFSEVLKEVIIWDKVNGQPAIQEGVLNSQYETILVFDKKNAISRKFDNAQFKRGTLSNVWDIKRGKKYSPKHGATFPEELAERVILNFTNENDVVLDSFSGLGTTAVATIRTGRKYVGFEIDEEYWKLSQERISECTRL